MKRNRWDGLKEEKTGDVMKLTQRLKKNEEHNQRLSQTVDKLLSGNFHGQRNYDIFFSDNHVYRNEQSELIVIDFFKCCRIK